MTANHVYLKYIFCFCIFFFTFLNRLAKKRRYLKLQLCTILISDYLLKFACLILNILECLRKKIFAHSLWKKNLVLTQISRMEKETFIYISRLQDNMSNARTWKSNVPWFIYLVCHGLSSEISKKLTSISSSYVVFHKEK